MRSPPCSAVCCPCLDGPDGSTSASNTVYCSLCMGYSSRHVGSVSLRSSIDYSVDRIAFADAITREDPLSRTPLHILPELRVGDRPSRGTRASDPSCCGARGRSGRTEDGGTPGPAAPKRHVGMGTGP